MTTPTEVEIVEVLGNIEDIPQTLEGAINDIRDLIERLVAERAEAREIVSKMNNTLIGSYGYFTEPSCVEAADSLKRSANKAVHRAEKTEAELRRAWDSITEKEASAFSVETAADDLIATSIRATENFCCAFNAQKKAEAALAEARTKLQRVADYQDGPQEVADWLAKQEPTPPEGG